MSLARNKKVWYKMAQNEIKLWLDDNRDPANPEIQKLFGAQGNEVWVKTVKEAKQYIQQGNVIFISFDHDLDNEGGTLPEADGNELAQWIEEEAFFGRLKPIGWNVHSKNPSGARDIVASMNKADEFWENNKNELV